MRIRVSKDHIPHLGEKAIIDGLVEIPIYAYNETTLKDDDNYVGCNYVIESTNYYVA
jgi:hypothetical protein